MPQISSSEPLCPDWVFSNNSNVHACKNRGWFTDYTPFESFAGSLLPQSRMPVLGVGTVYLPTKKAPGRKGRDAHGQLILHDVLHIPSLLCNIIGITEEDSNNLSISFGGNSRSRGTIKNLQGHSLAYFDPDPSKPLFQVKLSGPPVGPVVGPSVFSDPDAVYYLNVRWAQEEVARWEAFKQGSQDRPVYTTGLVVAPPTNNATRTPQPSAGYTDDEKAWLKAHYGNEFRFLQTHGLSIYKDEDREEGREIVRAFMADESENDEAEKSDEDMEGHVVDYLFDERSLDWIEKHYGTSMNFMYTNGLKFYDQDDCQVAQGLVEDFMQGR
ncbi:uncharacterized protein BDZ99DRAFT_511861 [Mytilinidion resinicola]|uniref:Retrovirus-related Pol polyprotein from transposon TNT 1-94-like beta-barrel domain-containing protein n=1 Tax=Mytilinidion resinicola TaxID=574789 RepID=A0A6A6Y4X4_9PEZI|nr:uncharacterized protein BDZ99DRAFT_511861 [Mytilinidion resinicola]KAF2803710.1 hypothetical protein BDZ99DRAFT_511861 [Mytilinidion resinicola]